MSPLLFLDQNYLSGIAKHKPAFHELEPVLREAVARGVVAAHTSAIAPSSRSRCERTTNPRGSVWRPRGSLRATRPGSRGIG